MLSSVAWASRAVHRAVVSLSRAAHECRHIIYTLSIGSVVVGQRKTTVQYSKHTNTTTFPLACVCLFISVCVCANYENTTMCVMCVRVCVMARSSVGKRPKAIFSTLRLRRHERVSESQRALLACTPSRHAYLYTTSRGSTI